MIGQSTTRALGRLAHGVRRGDIVPLAEESVCHVTAGEFPRPPQRTNYNKLYIMRDLITVIQSRRSGDPVIRRSGDTERHKRTQTDDCLYLIIISVARIHQWKLDTAIRTDTKEYYSVLLCQCARADFTVVFVSL